ncbi:hypothetical protein WMY93_015949 [Mugilogobius chulae]|uniref:Uncharacterized protein n=1 Tax=Mugilogobius chulae TaxID=88201 RepID=A0AAW0NSN1_9GOBI
MLLWKRALPLYVLFLCAAGEAPRGFCDDKKCSALFLESARAAAAAWTLLDQRRTEFKRALLDRCRNLGANFLSEQDVHGHTGRLHVPVHNNVQGFEAK